MILLLGGCVLQLTTVAIAFHFSSIEVHYPFCCFASDIWEWEGSWEGDHCYRTGMQKDMTYAVIIRNISWAYVYIYTLEAQIWNRIGPKTTLSLSVGIWEGEKEKRGEVKRNSSSKNHKIPFQAERNNCKRMNESVGPCVLCCGSSEVAVWTTSVSKSLKEKGVSWHC